MLLSTVTEKVVDGKKYNTENHEYVATIQLQYLADCPELQFMVNELKFKETKLISFVEKLNDCQNTGIATRAYVSTSKVIVKSGIDVSMVNNISWPAQGWSFGAGFIQEIRKPELSRSLYVSYGLDFEYGSETDDLKWFSKIAVPLDVNLEFGNSRFKPYISGGLHITTFIRQSKPTEWWSYGTQVFSGWPLTVGCGVKTKRMNLMLSANVLNASIKFIYYFN